MPSSIVLIGKVKHFKVYSLFYYITCNVLLKINHIWNIYFDLCNVQQNLKKKMFIMSKCIVMPIYQH